VRTVDSAGNVSDTSHFGPFKIDRTDPINPPLQSSSHTAGNWSTSNEVTVTGLDEASDAEGSSGAGASGVAGFSYVWNSNATTTPDASIEEAAGSVSFTSPALDEGSHYLHLRTVDGAGNAAGVVHLGPFKLDATAPSSVNLTTLSPFSKALSLPLAWTASTDEGSGFDGYTVASRSSMWNAAGLMTATFSDLPTKYTVTSATVQGTPGTSYCFKVRAADMLGNSSEGSESCTAVPLNDASLTRSGTWKTASSSDIYFDSKLSTSSVSGSKLTRQGIKGAKRLAVLVTTCNGCGTIQVLWNGVALQRAGTTSTKISLASTSTKKKVLVQLKPLAGLQDGTAIIKVVTSGKPVKIEGLGIARF
jgi:hypothetical protein